MENVIKYTELYNLLSKACEDELILNFKKNYPKFTEKQIKNHFFIKFEEIGISLNFTDGLLTHIYLNNSQIQGFQKYKGTLPYNLKFDDFKNKNIVEYFGDTPNKGGGNCPIWLEYKRVGLEFNLRGMFWNDLDNPINTICLFKHEENNFCSTCTNEIKTLFSCNKCEIVKYCSETCRNSHINFHLKYC